MAILVGRKADHWGRKPLFLAGFAVLPLRGLLFAISDNPYAIIAVQVLDGVGAGIFGALFYIVVSDLTLGTGRFNLAQGASAASWGLGAALSNGVAGLIVNAFGFPAAFFFSRSLRYWSACDLLVRGSGNARFSARDAVRGGGHCA